MLDTLSGEVLEGCLIPCLERWLMAALYPFWEVAECLCSQNCSIVYLIPCLEICLMSLLEQLFNGMLNFLTGVRGTLFGYVINVLAQDRG